jgi:hypothetical protein
MLQTKTKQNTLWKYHTLTQTSMTKQLQQVLRCWMKTKISDVSHAEGHVTPKGVILKGCVHVQPKLHNIRPSGAFSPQMTSSNVIPKGFPWVRCFRICCVGKKIRGKTLACAEHASGHVTDVTSGSSSSNIVLSVSIYYLHIVLRTGGHSPCT